MAGKVFTQFGLRYQRCWWSFWTWAGLQSYVIVHLIRQNVNDITHAITQIFKRPVICGACPTCSTFSPWADPETHSHTVQSNFVQCVAHTVQSNTVQCVAHTVQSNTVQCVAHTVQSNTVQCVAHTVQSNLVFRWSFPAQQSLFCSVKIILRWTFVSLIRQVDVLQLDFELRTWASVYILQIGKTKLLSLLHFLWKQWFEKTVLPILQVLFLLSA